MTLEDLLMATREILNREWPIQIVFHLYLSKMIICLNPNFTPAIKLEIAYHMCKFMAEMEYQYLNDHSH